MDVRCEKCLTVYELDDAKVGDNGLTVKCQECGNLFKVRRRVGTTEMVATPEDEADLAPTDPLKVEAIEPKTSPQKPRAIMSADGSHAPPPNSGFASDDDEDRSNDPTHFASSGTTHRTRRATMPTAPAQPRPEERPWMLRSASTGEVSRFRELTTLQQWIVERKVTRQDEISRGGDSWKPLGGIAELASFFHVVEQAQAVAEASQPALVVRRGADEPVDLPNMPTEMLSAQRRAPTGLGVSEIADAGDASDEPPRRSSGAGGFLVFLLVLGVLGAGGYFGYRFYRARLAAQAAPSAETRATVASLVTEGRAALRSDTDEGFRHAISSLDRAVELDPSSPASIDARVDLAEAHVTWAAYLLEDAHTLEASGSAPDAQAARTLRTDAQSHLERARRVLEDPSGDEANASPTLARAFGDLLRVEGAPPAASERYLQRAAQKGADDPVLAYTLGELQLREGQKAEALARFTEAVRHDGENGEVPLVRAHYRLLVLAREAGRKDDLRKECELILRVSPKHERARALCASDAVVDLGAAPVAPPDAAVVAGADTTLAPPPAPKPLHDATLAPPATSDYKTLIREADHLVESGRSAQARKIYEHALEVDPKGVAALTGLGYCDLDAERFLQSVDRFNAALQIDPSDGDAMIGLAESYKVRGMKDRAAELYRKYLAALPGGPKAPMARQNLREFERDKGVEVPAPEDKKPADAPKDAPKDQPVSQTPPDEPPP